MTTQVVERHIVRGLEKIFSPVIVNGLSDTEVLTVAAEPAAAQSQRQHLKDQIKKFEEGQKIFRGAL